MGFTNRNRARSNLKTALKSASQDPSSSFDLSLNVSFIHTSGNVIRTADFALHHHIHPTPDEPKLAEWMQKQKITPWVAVAAPLVVKSFTSQFEMPRWHVKNGVNFQGSLFTVLPLPIPNAQPVHIHALFSISPDRARLSGDDPSNTDQKPARWNEFLFQQSIPHAWTSLLGFVASSHSHCSTFDWWPRASQDSRDPLRNCANLITEQIHKRNLAFSLLSQGIELQKKLYLALERNLLPSLLP